MATFGAKTALKELQPLNHYDRHRTLCTCDVKKTASIISGHTWNILNHSSKDEVYLMDARNPDHFIDNTGNNTSHWFEKKRRIDSDGDGVIQCLDSSNVQEVMRGPPDTGKEASYLRQRQSRQLRQAEHPRDYGQFSARRDRDGLKTPERASSLAVKVPQQERLRDVAARPSPRVVSKGDWSARREERFKERVPPSEHEMFRNVDQLVTESHINTFDANLADAVHSSRAKNSARSGTLSARGERTVLGDMGTMRSQLGGARDRPPKPGAQRHQHSTNRVEPHQSRELSGWHEGHKDKLKREDPFFAKPVPNMGTSCVKYDIISNERKQFFY